MHLAGLIGDLANPHDDDPPESIHFQPRRNSNGVVEGGCLTGNGHWLASDALQVTYLFIGDRNRYRARELASIDGKTGRRSAISTQMFNGAAMGQK